VLRLPSNQSATAGQFPFTFATQQPLRENDRLRYQSGPGTKQPFAPMLA